MYLLYIALFISTPRIRIPLLMVACGIVILAAYQIVLQAQNPFGLNTAAAPDTCPVLNPNSPLRDGFFPHHEKPVHFEGHLNPLVFDHVIPKLPSGTILLRSSWVGQYHAALLLQPREFPNSTIEFPGENYTEPIVVEYSREGDLDPGWSISIVNMQPYHKFRTAPTQSVAFQQPKHLLELENAMRASVPEWEALEKMLSPDERQQLAVFPYTNTTKHMLHMLATTKVPSNTCMIFTGILMQTYNALIAVHSSDHSNGMITNSRAHVQSWFSLYKLLFGHVLVEPSRSLAQQRLLLWAQSVRQRWIDYHMAHHKAMMARVYEQLGRRVWRPLDMNCQHLVAYLYYGVMHSVSPTFSRVNLLQPDSTWAPILHMLQSIWVLFLPLLLTCCCCCRRAPTSNGDSLYILVSAILLHCGFWPMLLRAWLNHTVRSSFFWNESTWLGWLLSWALPFAVQPIAGMAMFCPRRMSRASLVVLFVIVAHAHFDMFLGDDSEETYDVQMSRRSMPGVLFKIGAAIHGRRMALNGSVLTMHSSTPILCNITWT